MFDIEVFQSLLAFKFCLMIFSIIILLVNDKFIQSMRYVLNVEFGISDAQAIFKQKQVITYCPQHGWHRQCAL